MLAQTPPAGGFKICHNSSLCREWENRVPVYENSVREIVEKTRTRETI